MRGAEYRTFRPKQLKNVAGDRRNYGTRKPKSLASKETYDILALLHLRARGTTDRFTSGDAGHITGIGTVV